MLEHKSPSPPPPPPHTVVDSADATAATGTLLYAKARGRIQRKTWCMGPHAEVDYNLTLSRLQSRLQQFYHGHPYARVDLNPLPDSTLSPPSGTLDLASDCSRGDLQLYRKV
jgi:hypothetical protein